MATWQRRKSFLVIHSEPLLHELEELSEEDDEDEDEDLFRFFDFFLSFLSFLSFLFLLFFFFAFDFFFLDPFVFSFSLSLFVGKLGPLLVSLRTVSQGLINPESLACLTH